MNDPVIDHLGEPAPTLPEKPCRAAAVRGLAADLALGVALGIALHVVALVIAGWWA